MIYYYEISCLHELHDVIFIVYQLITYQKKKEKKKNVE
jgi:hypothetical protein